MDDQMTEKRIEVIEGIKSWSMQPYVVIALVLSYLETTRITMKVINVYKEFLCDLCGKNEQIKSS